MKSLNAKRRFYKYGEILLWLIKTGKKNNGEDIGSAAFGGNALLPERGVPTPSP